MRPVATIDPAPRRGAHLDLTAREVAQILRLDESDVPRLVREQGLPAHRVAEDLRFNRVELQEWAVLRGRRLSARMWAPEGRLRELPSLRAALDRGGIHRVHAADAQALLASVADLPGVPSHVDRALLRAVLVAREAHTIVDAEGGIAVPHTRDPIVLPIDAPRVLLCLLEKPLDVGARSGVAVRALFLLLSPSVREHLQVLSELAYALHDVELREMIATGAADAALLARFTALDASVARGSLPPAETRT